MTNTMPRPDEPLHPDNLLWYFPHANDGPDRRIQKSTYKSPTAKSRKKPSKAEAKRRAKQSRKDRKR